jgi:hypothetical protein
MPTKFRVLCFLALPLLVSSCNRPGVTPVPPVRTSEPVKLEPGDARATLTVVRSMTHMLGHITITAAIPLSFGTNEGELEDRPMVGGMGAGIAELSGSAQGTGGGYDVSAEWSVEYVVEGLMTTGTGECEIQLDVEETLLLSREVIGHAAGMDIPMVAGEDEFTAFPKLVFTESLDPEVRLAGTVESVFTLDDVCMPAYLGCDRWQPCPG